MVAPLIRVYPMTLRAHAQAKYGSPLLSLVWIGSLVAQGLRVVLQYRRMFIQFDNYVSKQMLNRTVTTTIPPTCCFLILWSLPLLRVLDQQRPCLVLQLVLRASSCVT